MRLTDPVVRFDVSGDFLYLYLELLLLVLLVMLPAALLAGRYRALLIAVGLGALGLAFAGFGVMLMSPRDLVLKYLVLTHLLRPSLLGLALVAIFGTAVLLGVWRGWRGIGFARARPATALLAADEERLPDMFPRLAARFCL